MAVQQDTASSPTTGAGRNKAESVSVWQLYRERFRKHTLGRIGLAILLVLYLAALFADFLSPYSMTWTDKRKPYHPPSKIHLFDRTEEGISFRPFVYEQAQVSIAFREYQVVPVNTLRVASMPTRLGGQQLHAISWSQDPATQIREIMAEVTRQYRIPPGNPAVAEIQEDLQELARSGERNQPILKTYRVPDSNAGTREIQLYLLKGNKNYIEFFGKNVPYRFLNLFQAERRLFTTPTGGLFLLGTDKLGRDIVSRLLHGGRISLSVGLLGVAISFFIGVIIGGIAGYAGGRVDSGLMRLVEVMQSIPTIYLLFALRAAFPQNLDSVQVYLLIVLILSFTAWASLARIIRGMVLSIKTEEFVLAARSLGLSHLKIIRKHVLPNTMSVLIVQATLTVPGYILGESALSLLGLGITEPQSSWGLMLAAARNFRVMSQFPWVLIPGFFIFLAILAWNFFGDGIRDAVDPKGIIR